MKLSIKIKSLSAENCDERLSRSDDSKIGNKENECVERDQVGAYDLDDSCETTSDCALNLECVDNTCQNEGINNRPINSLVMLCYFFLIDECSCSDGRPKPQAFDESEVTGEIQKPDGFVTYNRENLNKSYELDLRESLYQKYLRALRNHLSSLQYVINLSNSGLITVQN